MEPRYWGSQDRDLLKVRNNILVTASARTAIIESTAMQDLVSKNIISESDNTGSPAGKYLHRKTPVDRNEEQSAGRFAASATLLLDQV